MNTEFWKQRWKEGLTGFHLNEVNPYLIKHWPAMECPQGSTVFVPLCGKTMDIIWLTQQGCKVIGVECSEKAILEFVQEHQLAIEISQSGPFTEYKTKDITLYQGDFFDLQPHHLKEVSAVFDRAALVALPPEMRLEYRQHLKQILPTSVAYLLITVEYNQSEMDGPPFSVTQEEVKKLYTPEMKLHSLQVEDLLAESPRFRQRGLTEMLEKIFLIQA